MKYREVEFPDGKIVYIETEHTFGKHISVGWMSYHKANPKNPEWEPETFASETYFSWGPWISGPFAIVGPPNFLERWFGVTHDSKIKKQVDRAYRKIEKELVDAKYQETVQA